MKPKGNMSALPAPTNSYFKIGRKSTSHITLCLNQLNAAKHDNEHNMLES